MTAPAPGVCRHCACREGALCWYCGAHFDDVTWSDGERMVCGNPACVTAEKQRTQPAPRPRSKYAGMGYGAVLEAMRKEDRNRRRRLRRGKKAA